MPFNFPIFLTWLRIAVIPLLVGIYYIPDGIFSLVEKNLKNFEHYNTEGIWD